MILYGLSGSGRTSICKALVSNLKELYGLENIIYSSMMISVTQLMKMIFFITKINLED
mgnify:CR=1 FL=1